MDLRCDILELNHSILASEDNQNQLHLYLVELNGFTVCSHKVIILMINLTFGVSFIFNFIISLCE
uniref:Uncharacterized protein n=1 Tax=Rhizophora mucronata TaxID=61149 RepID=A0A2P2QSU8_RHIMU